MIFYLAILLILCGFLIVISALFIEIREAKALEENKPAESKIKEENRPVENKAAEEYRPVENRIPEINRPVENKATEEYKPVENRISEINRPVEDKTAEEYRPVENKITEEKKPVEIKSSNNYNGSNKREDMEIVFSDELNSKNSIFTEFEDTYPDLREPVHVLKQDEFHSKSILQDKIEQKNGTEHSAHDKLNAESEIVLEVIDSFEDESALQEEKNEIVYAVMFDDRSDIIDYSSEIGTIDSTFLKYRDIKRIGKGVIESDSDGISFYLDEKLYRFDSHRIYDIWCGENYLALPIKGNGAVKLFIIENSTDFSYKVEADFKEFEQRSYVL